MFEDQYRKHYQEIAPSPELTEETLALMQEARDHRATEPEVVRRWRPAVIIPLAGTVAAAIAAVVLVGVGLRGNNAPYNDEVGSLELFISAESEEDADTLPETEGDSDQPEEEPEPELPEETPEEEKGTTSNTESTEEENTAQPPEKEEPPTENSTEEPEDTKGDAPEKQEEKVDPRDPDIVNDNTTVTYTTIRQFLTALADKKTPGYGDCYYNARELIIVPASLPNSTRFRHFHLNTETGSYSYSYLFSKDNKDYFIDVEVAPKLPLTLRDLYLQKQAIKSEEIRTAQRGNQLHYLFGEKDYVTVTVTEYHSDTALTEEQVGALMEKFTLERCSITNNLIDITY